MYLARFFVKMLLVYKLYRANAINVADWIYLPSSLYSQLLQLFTEWISSKLKRDEKALMFRVRGAWIPYSFNPNPEKPFDNPEVWSFHSTFYLNLLTIQLKLRRYVIRALHCDDEIELVVISCSIRIVWDERQLLFV